MMELDDIDGIAAEYVLGTLSRDERAGVAAMRATRHDLDHAITAWGKRLAALNEDTPDAIPSPELFTKIQQLIASQSQSPDRPSPLDRQLRLWRTLALAASLAFCVVTSFMVYRNAQPSASPHLVAVLQQDGAAPAFLATLDQKTGVLNIRALAASSPPDKSYELWLVAEGAAPRSLGVLPPHEDKDLPLSGLDPAIVQHATLAISLEPPGGSPTGVATGPVVFIGKFAPG
jgi:anti-sigma-K factor RskA